MRVHLPRDREPLVWLVEQVAEEIIVTTGITMFLVLGTQRAHVLGCVRLVPVTPPVVALQEPAQALLAAPGGLEMHGLLNLRAEARG